MAVLPFKPRVAKTIARIDRKTQAVTASVNFEDIDLRINGEGSEAYDYEYMFVLHSQTPLTTNYVKMYLNELTNYSRDFMSGNGVTLELILTIVILFKA